MKVFKHLVLWVLLAFAPFAFAEAIDINAADTAGFEKAMKGVGPVKSKAIVDYRAKNGPFKSVEDLLKVDGIGKKTLDDNRANLSVGGVAAPAAVPAATSLAKPTVPATAAPAAAAAPAATSLVKPTVPATPAAAVPAAAAPAATSLAKPTVPATTAVPAATAPAAAAPAAAAAAAGAKPK
jgi:competence ComEA-like helix-hairpin-helix protein